MLANDLTDWELASRLSYFLWSSMPDDAPLHRGQKAALSGEGLKKEVDTDVDGRAGSTASSTTSHGSGCNCTAWACSRRTRNSTPPTTTGSKRACGAEPVEYFREMLTNNLPIEGFLDSDWTMANARLCDFYGLPEPKQDGFQRVSLKPEDHRGGLLTMGAVLGLTSDGTRHRPVHRGVWLSEAIFQQNAAVTSGQCGSDRARFRPRETRSRSGRELKRTQRTRVVLPVIATSIHWAGV